jgi:hypothetical protein
MAWFKNLEKVIDIIPNPAINDALHNPTDERQTEKKSLYERKHGRQHVILHPNEYQVPFPKKVQVCRFDIISI